MCIVQMVAVMFDMSTYNVPSARSPLPLDSALVDSVRDPTSVRRPPPSMLSIDFASDLGNLCASRRRRRSQPRVRARAHEDPARASRPFLMAAGADGRVSRNRGGNGDARGPRVESLTFARLARVAEEHLRPGHEEHRVRDVGCDAAAVNFQQAVLETLWVLHSP